MQVMTQFTSQVATSLPDINNTMGKIRNDIGTYRDGFLPSFFQYCNSSLFISLIATL